MKIPYRWFGPQLEVCEFQFPIIQAAVLGLADGEQNGLSAASLARAGWDDCEDNGAS